MNLDYKLFYLLFAENSDAGDPASCCSIRHFLSLESARTVMKEGFAAYQKACGGLDVEDDEHESPSRTTKSPFAAAWTHAAGLSVKQSPRFPAPSRKAKK